MMELFRQWKAIDPQGVLTGLILSIVGPLIVFVIVEVQERRTAVLSGRR